MCGGKSGLVAASAPPPDGGGGAATLGVGRAREVQTRGEVEPCRLDVKARAPIKRFSGVKDLMAASDALIGELRERVPKLRGVFDRSDAMLAVYGGQGARFAKHVDNTTADGRRLTVLVYLNPSWTPAMGGALRIHPPKPSAAPAASAEAGAANDCAVVAAESGPSSPAAMPAAVDIYPVAGRMALLWSSEVPHEVMPAYGPRHAITCWWYDRAERRAALEAAERSGRAAALSSKVEPAAQEEAQAFIAFLVGLGGGGGGGGDGGEVSLEELASVAERGRALSSPAAEVVAAITGAESPEALRTGLETVTARGLAEMRDMFRHMGLT